MTDIFISYSSNDREKVSKLAHELQLKGMKVWFDDEQIIPGDDLIEKIRNGISSSKFYVICLSPSFGKKPPTSWVKREFKMAMLKENREERTSIIPVRIKKGGSIPEEIGGRAYADLTTNNRWEKNFPKLCKALGA